MLETDMKKIGIIGCGTIGTGIAEFIQANLYIKARVVALCDIDSKKAESLSKKIKPHPVVTTIDNLIKKSDLIIEAASAKISGIIAEKSVFAGKDVLIMSTGGLLKKTSLFEKAKSKGCSIYIPSGAICGLDGLRSAGIGRITRVNLTTRKPPRGLKGAPYLKEKNIDIEGIDKETLVYSGNAEEAIKYFPQNVNVAATLSILGIGPRRTNVRIIASPAYTKNIHEVEVEGEFGRLFTRTENVPSKNNPKTSQLAIFSALAKLKEVL
jgi:aspartate dehydrogenase